MNSSTGNSIEGGMKSHLTRDGKAFLRALDTSQGGLLWRQNEWQILCSNGTAIVVSRRRHKMIQNLVSAGLLIAGDDSILRPATKVQKSLRTKSESPLQAALEGQIQDYFDNDQKRAADRLRRDHDLAQLSPKLVARYAPLEGSESSHYKMSDNSILKMSDAALEARDRVHAAFEAVGPELASILYHVCCLASGLESAERQLQMPRRAGKAILSLALTRLARHYGLKKPMRHGGPGRIGHWAMADFKPAIPPPQHLP
jgi:hypothetical protein